MNRLSLRAAATSSLFVLWAAASAARATTYYVATNGSDLTNDGKSTGAAYATIAKAVSSAAKGDTILVRGGTYAMTSTLSIGSSKSGTAAQPFTLASYGDAAPVVLDFNGAASGQRGVQLNASHWTIRGLTVQNAKDNGINVAGSYNLIDRVVARNNQDSGVQIGGSGASYNVVRNTDSYANYDPAAHGENADGFAAKFRDLGPGNVFDGCRAWGNSDDGWDLWAAASGVTIRNSYSFKNGFNTFGDADWQGDGNGVKLGHDSGTHVLTNNVLWGNRLNGIDVNGNALALEYPDQPIAHGVTVENNTAYNNGAGGNGLNYFFDEQFAHVLKNNIALAGGGNARTDAGVVHDHNTWNAGFPVSAADFLSLDDSLMTAARLADGSLPYNDFLRLKPTSALVDAGTNVGLAYNGRAPDLGAFEVPEPASLGIVATVGLVARRGRRRR